MQEKSNQLVMGFYLILMICLMFGISIPVKAEKNANKAMVIALDPGHGEEETGAQYYGIQEKDINLRMAQLVQEELERYPDVEVILVRESDEKVSLSERVRRASQAGADVLFSLHFNASSSHKSNGASVYISTGENKKESLRKLADCLLGEFEAIGLQNAGTFARVTQMGGRRGDGSFDDYYGVLRHSYNYGIPAMIIEHCYMDSETDKEYFMTEEGLRKLAKADADGIAAYYELTDEEGNSVVPKHAKVFGATTKAVEADYYDSPEILSVKLSGYDGMTPGLATYEVEVKDGIGISSIYLVYKNVETGDSYTVSMGVEEVLTTGIYTLQAYVPSGAAFGRYRLCYVGACNVVGFDAGYNYADGNMVGYGKCDWLNTFQYNGEADLQIINVGYIFEEHANQIINRVREDLETKRKAKIITIYPAQL